MGVYTLETAKKDTRANVASHMLLLIVFSPAVLFGRCLTACGASPSVVVEFLCAVVVAFDDLVAADVVATAAAVVAAAVDELGPC